MTEIPLLTGPEDPSAIVNRLNQLIVEANAQHLLLAEGGGSRELISTATASASSSVDFTGIDSTYDRYEIEFDAVKSDSAPNVTFTMRTSSDGGVTYDSGATDYRWVILGRYSGGANLQAQSAGDSEISLGGNILTSNGTGDNFNGKIILTKPYSTTLRPIVEWRLTHWRDSNAFISTIIGGGVRDSAGLVDAVRFLFTSGNIAEGEFRMYGVKKS